MIHAKSHRLSVKYKAYGDSSAHNPSAIVQRKPSELIKYLSNPPPLHRDGVARPKPCIIEKIKFSQEPYQLLSSVPEDEPLFQPFPPEINFSDYEPFEKYTCVLKLRNNDKTMRRVQVLSMDPEILKVHRPYDQGNEMYIDIGTNKVACGMEVTYVVTFSPESDDDYQSELVVVTDREKFVVPVRCFGKKPILSLPDEILFPSTPVKCCSKKNLTIQNIGNKTGLFSISVSGVFDIKPTKGLVEKGSFFQCEITFQPNHAEDYQGELKIFYTNYNQYSISKLLGSGCELDIGLSTSLVTAPLTFINKSFSMNIQLINESSSIVQFMWPEFAHDNQENSSCKDLTNLTMDNSQFADKSSRWTESKPSESMVEAFSLTPAAGEIWPGTIMDITVTFSPKKALRYVHTTHCVVSGKSNPLILELQGIGIGPQVQLVPDFHDLGHVNLFSTYNVAVVLQNTGELEAIFRLMAPKKSDILKVKFEPDSGALYPMESQTIVIEVVCTGMGAIDEMFLWEVDGVLYNLSLKLRGHVGAPRFELETEKIDLGNICYGVECTKQLRLHNTSPVCLPFSFQIQKCEDSFCDYKVVPEACLLHPDEAKILRISITPLEETKHLAKLILDVQDIGDSLAVVSLQAECFSPKVHLSSESLSFGNCLIRYNYTQVLELVNSTNVPAVYEVLPQEHEHMAIANVLVDAAYGVIPPLSQIPLKITIATHILGQVSLSLPINISGKDSNPLTVAISAYSVGPTLRIENLGSNIQSSMINPENADDNDIIVDYGKIHVLQDVCRIILVTNLSCIPAHINVSLSKKKTVFCLEQEVYALEPFGSQEIKVVANLDDTAKFTDILKIVAEGSCHSVRLKASGIGSTIVCADLAVGIFDFGKQVTLRPFSHIIHVENHGRKQQTLSWENKYQGIRSENLKEYDKNSMNALVSGQKNIFSVLPEKAIIKPYSSCEFTLTGYATSPGSFCEEVRCNVTTTKALLSHKLSVSAKISPLKLLLSDSELTFTQNNNIGENTEELTRTLTCQNISELPLHFELSTKPPFFVIDTKYVLQPSESINVIVGLERQDCEDKLSKVIHGVLDVIYSGTLEREALKLCANIYYPNLEFDILQLNFGCVIENTMKKQYLTVKNSGSLVANYHWFLLEDDENSFQGLEDKVDLNQIFDILPIRGCLKPGEEESIEFSYYACSGYHCDHVIAICEVEAGPRYNIELIAESGLIAYSLSETSLDFGLQQFNQISEKNFTLYNTGKIPISFSLSLPHSISRPSLKIHPLQGNIAPFQKQTFQVLVSPVLPEKYEVAVKIQISHFLPQQIQIFGGGVYPHLLIDLPRIRNNSFLLVADQGLSNLSKTDETAAQLDASEAGNCMPVLQASSSEVPNTSGGLTLEQVDAEIDRLLFIQFLMEADVKKKSPSPDQISSEIVSQKEHASDKSITSLDKFVLNKYLCDFGNVILGESHQKAIHIINDSVLPVSFKGDKSYLKGTGFFFEPDQQIRLSSGISGCKMMELNIMLKTDGSKFKPGEIEAPIPLHIKEAPRTLLLLRANVTKPLLDLSTEILDFQSVQLGHCKVMHVQLHNAGKVPCSWEIVKSEPNSSDVSSKRDASAFRFSPTHGTVMPNECFNVEIRFTPSHKQHAYSAKFSIKILHDSNLQFIHCKGHSYSLSFHIEPAELQLAPIIPKAVSPIESNLELVNSSDESIEVYSLDFDTQYITEENILRDRSDYNEEGCLFLPPRKAGQPFWKETVEVPEVVAPEIHIRAPRDSWRSAKDKLLPSKRGKHARKPKEEPVETPIEEIPIFETNTPVLIVHGPPLGGKTTQAKHLSAKFHFPVVDIQELIQSLDIKFDETMQPSVGLAGELMPEERELIEHIKKELKKIDYKHGVIFDGLYFKKFETASFIVKCLLYAVGLRPTIQQSNSEGDVPKDRISWTGNPTIYVLKLEFDQTGLADRYAKIPEVYHARKHSESFPDRCLPKCYPYYTRFPSQEELEKFFYFEPFLYDVFGHCNEDGATNILEQRVTVFKINGMQDELAVFQEQLKYLPSPGPSIEIPMPCTFEVVRKPSAKPSSAGQLNYNFSMLTPITKVESNEEAINKEKEGKKTNGKVVGSSDKRSAKGKFHSDQMSEAGSAIDDKMSTSTRSVATRKGKKEILSMQHVEEFLPLDIIPEGFCKQSRWIIPPHSSIKLLLRFWAAAEQNFDNTFFFQAVGIPGKLPLHCKAICARPQITCYLKKPAVKSSLAKMQRQKFKKDRVLDFDAIPAGIKPEGFPGVQDSEHSMRLMIHNTGRFDLHANFEVVPSPPVSHSPKSTKQPAFFIHPTFMDLKIDESQDLRIYAYPRQDQLGIMEAKLTCRVMNNPDQIDFALRCCSDTPRISLEPSTLNFERLLIGLHETKDITIRNICALPIKWKLLGVESAAKELKFSESSGTIDAMQASVIQVSFDSIEEKILKEKFRLQVFHVKNMEKAAQEVTLNIMAEAFKMDISVKIEDSGQSGSIDFGIMKITDDASKSLILQNKGKYAISFCFVLRNIISKIFSVTSMEGVLEPKKEQKVTVRFNKEKKLTKEVNLKDNQDFQLFIYEALTRSAEKKIVIPVNIKAVYSKFALVPAHGIHFGSLVCGSISSAHTLEILNVGEFPFTYTISALSTIQNDLTETEISRQGDKGRETEKVPERGKGVEVHKSASGKSKKQKVPSSSKPIPETLDLKSFTLSPASGTVSPNQKQCISVYFKAETPGNISESIKIKISDCDILQYPHDVEYNIAGESCMPGMVTAPEVVFEEYDVVECADSWELGVPPRGTFSKKDNLFSFGAVILGSSSTEQKCSNSGVDCKLKIQNPFKVPCSLRFSICANPRQAGVLPLCMTVSPPSVDIPPLEHTYVTCSFHPSTMERYFATLDATLMIRGQAHSDLFKFELVGEGTLPSVCIESPSSLSPSGMPWLMFPRLLIGKTQELPIILRNKGLVPVVARLEPQGKSSLNWISFTWVHGEAEIPYQLGSSFTIPTGGKIAVRVAFYPTEIKQYKCEVQLIVDSNPFENVSIQITGDGYDEDIVFIGLPQNSDNNLKFEDCPIGCQKSIEFHLKNKRSDKLWHFEWPTIPYVAFSPASDYLLEGESKRICATFAPDNPIRYTNHDVKLAVFNVTSKGDDLLGNPENKENNRSARELSNSGKTQYTTIKGSSKVISAKLQAVADTIRYECSTQEINFRSTMMFQRRAFKFALKNQSNVTMAFNWMVAKLDGSLEEGDLYSVSPQSGSIEGKGCVEVAVKFCPIEVEDCRRNLLCDIPHLDPASCPPLKILLSGSVSRPWCYFELPRSNYPAQRNAEQQHPIDPDTNVIEFDSVGPNQHNIKYFSATNPTSQSYNFVWERRSVLQAAAAADPFKCLTKRGEIAAGKKYEMAFEFIPTRGELYESTWTFRIPEQEIDVSFLLVGNVRKPRLFLDRSIVNFGEVLVGGRAKHILHLHNDERVPFAFNFVKMSHNRLQSSEHSAGDLQQAHEKKPMITIHPVSAIVEAASILPIEFRFAPHVEGCLDMKATCNVKNADPLVVAIKGEAYRYHESVYIETMPGESSRLAPKETNNVDIGQVQANEKIFRRFRLVNDGTFPFQFLWDWGQQHEMAVHVEPCSGTVARDEQLISELSISTEGLKERFEIPLTCQVMNGNRYDVNVSGVCYHPKLRFSFQKHDFGVCFVNHATHSTELVITNDDVTSISCELRYKNTNYLEVDPLNTVLEGGQRAVVGMRFRPDGVALYKEAVRFLVNGLDTVTVNVQGEGTPMLVEVVDPQQKKVAFGTLSLGHSAKRRVEIINRSKLAMDEISFEACSEDQLKKKAYGITCSPLRLKLAPKQIESIELHFHPQTRIPSFTDTVSVCIAGGTVLPLLTVSGACLATDVALSASILPFDSAVLGSRVTKRIQIGNSGDLAATFSWDTSPCSTEFSIVPKDGFLAPHHVATVEVVFHPTAVNPEIVIQGVPCVVTGGKTLFLTLTGCSRECESVQETLVFQTPVRTPHTKTIQLKNESKTDWLVHPKIRNECWRGAPALSVPAGGTVGYDITYQPLTMTGGGGGEEHRGSILFPLPDGSALQYELRGQAGPPLPEAGEFKFEVKARSDLFITLPVRNWLRVTQGFVVCIKPSSEGPWAVVKGPQKVDVPGMSRRDCAICFHAYKAGTKSVVVELRNEASGEYLFFEVKVEVTKADAVQKVMLKAPVREKVVETIELSNPLDKPLVFTARCSNPEVRVSAAHAEVPPHSCIPLEVAYRPLLERGCEEEEEEVVSSLYFENETVGEVVYELHLRSAPRPMEPPLRFSVALGRNSTKTFQFRHYAPSKATFTCEIEQGEGGGFALQSKTVTSESAAGHEEDGVGVEVVVMYEPCRVTAAEEGILRVRSAEAGEYKCKLEGVCSAPMPQGPYVVKGSASIPFKNVFSSAAHYSYAVDNPAFTVGKAGEKLGAKQATTIKVGYHGGGGQGAGAATAKLTVICPEQEHKWVFYLQGVHK